MVSNIVRSQLLRVGSSSGPTSSRLATSSRLFTSSANRLNTTGPWAEALPSGRPLHSYLVVAEDDSNGGLARRLASRSQHLEEARAGKQSGRITLGGGLLSIDHHQIKDGEPVAEKLIGSVLVVKGESLQDVKDRLSQDQYSLNNVFDTSKIKVYPFLQASLGSDSPIITAAIEDEANAVASKANEVVKKATPSLGQLREEETNKVKKRAMKSLAFLRQNQLQQQNATQSAA